MQFSTNKILVEVTCETQDGPRSAIDIVQMRLKCPAVTNIKIVEVYSNYRLHQEPDVELRRIDH